MEETELLRYSRHILLPQIGVEGQIRLAQSTALIVGLGGLGSPASMYLAAAGIGHLIVCDFDVVELSNLQRQIVHTTEQLGQTKVDSAHHHLQALNPKLQITSFHQQLDTSFLIQQLAHVDIVLDCCDNMTTRLAVNQACVMMKVPLVSGAAIRMEGQLAVLQGYLPQSPCYRCIYPNAPELDMTCTRNGVLAPITGVIGSLQALETIKFLTMEKVWTDQLFIFDALTMDSYQIKLLKKPNCPVCSLVGEVLHDEPVLT